jgi:hypothetical protein
MNSNEEALTRFYTAFATLDADTMAACYAEHATFDHTAFSLKGRRADWRFEFKDERADDSSGHMHWEAHYRFSVSNRLVHNITGANFTFTPQSLIASHTNHFDFWHWSRQAWVMAAGHRFSRSGYGCKPASH